MLSYCPECRLSFAVNVSRPDVVVCPALAALPSPIMSDEAALRAFAATKEGALRLPAAGQPAAAATPLELIEPESERGRRECVSFGRNSASVNRATGESTQGW